MSDRFQSALDAMNALRDELIARLMQNADYRAMVALDKAIAEVQAPAGASFYKAMTAHHIVPAQSILRQTTNLSRKPAVSQEDATAMVLEELGEPLGARDLVPLVREKGALVGGEKPHINLGSTLSRVGRFRSVVIDGQYVWWFRDRPFPGELDFGGTTDADTSAAEEEEIFK